MNKQKTVLVVVPPSLSGGERIEKYALEVSRSLSRDYFWKIVFLTTAEAGAGDSREESESLVFYRLKAEFKTSRGLFSGLGIGKIKDILENEKPDIINIYWQGFGVGNILLFLNSRIPVIVTLFGNSLYEKNILTQAFESIVLRLTLRRANYILFASDFILPKFFKRYIFKSAVNDLNATDRDQASFYDDLFSRFVKDDSARKTRILLVAPYFYPKIGGMEKYSYNIAKRFKSQGGYEVSVITSNYESSSYRQDSVEGMKIHRLPIMFKFSNTPINLCWYWWIKKIIDAERPDIIHAHASVPYMADVASLFSKKIPFVLTYHSGSMLKQKWPIDFMIWVYEKFFLRVLLGRADVVVAVSQSFLNCKLGKAFAFKTELINPGVDNAQYSARSSEPSQKIVSFVGRVERSSDWKGINYLLEAMALVVKIYPDARLEIVGGGDAIEDYRNQAQKLGIEDKVDFLGFKTGTELLNAYGRSSVVVLPSVTKAESFGMVLLEAMASGCPVIGSDIGGIPYLIENEKNGLLVLPRNPEKLAQAITRIFDDKALVENMVRGGLVTAQNLDWQKNKDDYARIFSSLLKKKHPVAQLVAYYPPHIGGMEVVAREISLGLAKENYPVSVFTSDCGKQKDTQDVESVNYRVHRLKSFEFAHTPIAWSLFFRLLALPRNSILHVHLAQFGLPEIAYLVAKLRGFPIVMHFHLDVMPSGRLGFLLPYYKKYILGYVLRRADRVIVFSKEQSLLVRNKYSLEDEKIAIIPNGVASDFFNDKEKNAPTERLKILFVGRLSVQKRLELLIQAISLLKCPAELIVVGDGEDRQKLEDMVQELGLDNVKFVGRKSGKDLKDAYATADVLAITSEREGMPLVVLEAMAAGLPIVGSDVAGIHELVDGVGILIEGFSPEKFAQAFEELWENPQEIKELSRRSREKAKEYSWDRLIGLLEVVYKEIEK